MMKRTLRMLLISVAALLLCACGAQKTDHYAQGERYLSNGEYEKAITAFSMVIEKEPDRAEAYVKRGEAYFGIGKTEEYLDAAQADYETAVEIDDSNAQAYLGLAGIYACRGESVRAAELLRGALEKTGNNTAVAVKLAELQELAGKDAGKYHDLYLAYVQSFQWVGYGDYDADTARGIGREGVCDYYFYDLDKDGVDELLIVAGTARANGNCLVFRGSGTEVESLGAVPCASVITLFGSPDRTGLIIEEYHTGLAWAARYDIVDGRLTELDSDMVNADDGETLRFPAAEDYALEPAGHGERTAETRNADARNCSVVPAADLDAVEVDHVPPVFEDPRWFTERAYAVYDSSTGETVTTFRLPVKDYFYDSGECRTLAQTERYLVVEICIGEGSFHTFSYDVREDRLTKLPMMFYSSYGGYLVGTPVSFDADAKWVSTDQAELSVWNMDGTLAASLVSGAYGTCSTCRDNYIYYSFADENCLTVAEDGTVSYDYFVQHEDIAQQIWRFDLTRKEKEYVATVTAAVITEIGPDYVISRGFGNDWDTVRTISF